jgi:hypothetical protein
LILIYSPKYRIKRDQPGAAPAEEQLVTAYRETGNGLQPESSILLAGFPFLLVVCLNKEDLTPEVCADTVVGI